MDFFTVFVCGFCRTNPSLWLVRVFLPWTAFDARKKKRGIRNGSGWVVWNVAANLATLYHFGWGTSPDGKKAAELYEAVGMMGIAKEHISALAYHNLSTLYIVGAPGLCRDTEKAEEYHRLAKDLGFEM